jgi:hypothetical protein
MRNRGWARIALVLGAAMGAALPVRHAPASAPPPAVPGRPLLGNEPEPDAGPVRSGTPPQAPPTRFRLGPISISDPMSDVQRLKRDAEQLPGPLLGPVASADAARYRHLLDALRADAAPPSELFSPPPAHPELRRMPDPPVGPPRLAPGLRLAFAARREWTDQIASPVAWGKLPVRAGQPVTLEARDVAGPRPLLYLIRRGAQVAFSDEGDGASAPPARVTYTPDGDGELQFLVRGPGDGTIGRCDLYLDGELLFRGVTFGGAAAPARWSAGDEFQTAHRPGPEGRAVDTVLYAFDGRDHFVARNDDGGVNGCSRLALRAASTRPDAHVLVATASQDPADGGTVRLYANRLSQGDPDGDHLATPLEIALGTDPHAPDTDGDGLRDDWEVFGVHTPEGDEDLPAYWDPASPAGAANPTRLDLFVELDWMAGEQGEPDYYRLTDAAVDRLARAMRDQGGIYVHVDLGQMGTRGSRGGQSFPYQPRFAFTGASPHSMQDLWSSAGWLAPSRRHLFAYGLMIDRFAPGVNTSGEMRRMYEDGRIINTPEVWNPHYSPGFLIANGTGIYNLPRRQASVLMHEVGHCLHLHHGGNVDTNNKPNYLSCMNYLFTISTLTDDGEIDYSHGGLPQLDETALDEKAGLGFVPSDHVYRLLRGSRRTDVRTPENRAAVDWNNNGRIDPDPVAVDIDGNGVQEVLTDFNDWREARRATRGFGWVGLNAGRDDWTSFTDAP